MSLWPADNVFEGCVQLKTSVLVVVLLADVDWKSK